MIPAIVALLREGFVLALLLVAPVLVAAVVAGIITGLLTVFTQIQDPSVSLVLYSGRQGAQAELDKAVPPGWITAYLQKPFAIDDLAGVLK